MDLRDSTSSAMTSHRRNHPGLTDLGRHAGCLNSRFHSGHTDNHGIESWQVNLYSVLRHLIGGINAHFFPFSAFTSRQPVARKHVQRGGDE